jgi:hypothetical protein
MVECPYCQKDVEVDHDDGAGYEENTAHRQTCKECGKTFVFYTSRHFSYDAQVAPCLNNEEHDWQPINGFPKEVFVGRARCSYCDEEQTIDREAHEKAMKQYYDDRDREYFERNKI